MFPRTVNHRTICDFYRRTLVNFHDFWRRAPYTRRNIWGRLTWRVYEIALPFLFPDRSSHASIFPARKGSTLPNKGRRSNKERSQLHDGSILSPRRTSALLRFPDSSSRTPFFPATRSALNFTLSLPQPDRIFSPTIVPVPTPFPRLPTPSSLLSRPATTPRESSVNVRSRI